MEICSRCGESSLKCNCENYHPNKMFEMTMEEAHNLYHFLSHEYISHEFYQPTHDMLKRLTEFIK